MPELPEVEILKRELSTTIINKIISSSYSSNKKFKRTIANISFIHNSKILNIFRRNKYLILELSDSWLIIHLGMTGQLIFSKTLVLDKHTHFYVIFSDGSSLKYDDPRRFGSVDLYLKNEFNIYYTIPLFKNLGMEPLSKDFKFNIFTSFFNKTKTIKSFLMDAKYVCGIGNIYANEILFLAKIHPTRIGYKITLKEKKILYKLIPEVLEKSINLGGSSISDFVHTNGTTGEMQKFYNVYGRTYLPCNICNSKIEKISQNGRSSFFCPKCQS